MGFRANPSVVLFYGYATTLRRNGHAYSRGIRYVSKNTQQHVCEDDADKTCERDRSFAFWTH